MSSSFSDADGKNNIRCEILWLLSRRHTWGSPIPIDDISRQVSDAYDPDDIRDILNLLKRQWFTKFQRGEGLGIKNDPDSQAFVAYELKDDCGYSEFRIEATLSRFEQAGGFSAYDEAPDPPE